LQIGNWFGYSGIAVGAIGFIAALRNMTDLVQPIAEINNAVLPIWLIVLGVVLVRWRVVVVSTPVCAMTRRSASFARAQTPKAEVQESPKRRWTARIG
jgi:hypothetical protein